MVQRRATQTLKVFGKREHVAIVRLGAIAIREWREKHPKVPLDLRGTDLSALDLSHADLSGARMGAAMPDERPVSLRETILRNAQIRRANLRMADLSVADLRDADLRGSQLSIVDFSHADLTGANLSNTILIATNFNRAKVEGLNLANSIVGHDMFTNVDLSAVSGLQTLEHRFPSSIDVETPFLSQGDLPESFLRGCGVPDALITNLRALVGSAEPIQFESCFISFSSHDQAFAERLHSRLRDSGVRVWFSPEDIQGGRKLYDQVDRAIQIHDRLLVVLSEQSVKSSWVLTEIRRALETETKEKRRVLFPIRLCDMDLLREWQCIDSDTGKDLAREVREYFIPDFSNWKDHDSFERAMERLLRDLRASADNEGN